MSKLITLDHFHTTEKHFYIYMLNHSTVASEIHYHDYFQMLFVLSGEIRHIHDSHGISLFRGDAFITPPMFTHRLEFVNPSTEVYSLAFAPELFHSGFSQSNIYRFLMMLVDSAAGENDIHLKISLDKQQRKIVSMLMECLVTEQASCSSSSLSAVPSLISSALYILAQSYQNRSGLDQPLTKTEHFLNIQACMQYLDDHYAEDITIEKLSRKFALSRSVLCSLFSQYTGLSLKRYVKNKRILAAEQLLRSRPDLSLSEVAAAVGYQDPSTLFRNFRDVVGVSPSRYRSGYFRSMNA